MDQRLVAAEPGMFGFGPVTQVNGSAEMVGALSHLAGYAAVAAVDLLAGQS